MITLHPPARWRVQPLRSMRILIEDSEPIQGRDQNEEQCLLRLCRWSATNLSRNRFQVQFKKVMWKICAVAPHARLVSDLTHARRFERIRNAKALQFSAPNLLCQSGDIPR